MLSPPIPRSGPRKGLEKYRPITCQVEDLRSSKLSPKRLESEKLAEKLARDSLDINSNSDKVDGTVAWESVKTCV